MAVVAGHAGLWRSFFLVGFILAPLAVVALIGLRMRVPAWPWRRCAATVCLTAIGLWFLAWSIAPIARSDGERLRSLIFYCDGETRDVRFEISLSGEHMKLMRDLEITDLSIRSGWYRSNSFNFRKASIEIKIPGNGRGLQLTTEGYALKPIPFSALETVASEGAGAIDILVQETYKKPIKNYFGWQKAGSGSAPRGMTGCGRDIVPAVDLRGYRDGESLSRLFFY